MRNAKEESLPLVSIGIAFFNAERFIGDAIRSVLAQTHRKWELILVDDGSTDKSLEIARSFDDPRIRVYSDGDNRRLAARLNQITKLAKYDFIARMDADDMMAPDRIAKQLRFLVNNPRANLVSSGVCTITDEGVPIGKRIPRRNSVHDLTGREALLGRTGIVHASVVARKSWMIRNPYDPLDIIAQDYHLWIRAGRKDDLAVGFIQEPLYYYREEGSVTAFKILLGYKLIRRALRVSGPDLLTKRELMAVYLEFLAKSFIVKTADCLGATRHVVRNRSIVRLDRMEQETIARKIERVLKGSQVTERVV